MSQNQSEMPEAKSPVEPQSSPNPALKRLERLLGTWELRGRTLDSDTDNLIGSTVVEWMSGGHFMIQHGEITFMDFKLQSLEILHYDPATDTFPSTVYSSFDEKPAVYGWNVQGNVVTHWTAGSIYTGTFSDDGNTLTGGWRPTDGVESTAGNTYDAVMIRIK